MTRATIAISACLLLTVAALAEPRRQSTSRGRLKAVPTATISTSETTVAPDTLHSETQNIEIAGYDKPATASKETFFVVNNTGRTLTELTVTFTYTDMQGRQLHQATHTIACSIPPRGTRMLSVPPHRERTRNSGNITAALKKYNTIRPGVAHECNPRSHIRPMP